MAAFFFCTSKAFSWSYDADLNSLKKIIPVTFCKMSATNLLGCPLLFCSLAFSVSLQLMCIQLCCIFLALHGCGTFLILPLKSALRTRSLTCCIDLTLAQIADSSLVQCFNCIAFHFDAPPFVMFSSLALSISRQP